MKNTVLFSETILSKCFSKMNSEIRAILMSLLMCVAEDKGYLEAKTAHADAIGWHLDKISMDEMKVYVDTFFIALLKIVKRMNIGPITLAFDETYEPYYGKKWSLWIHAYKNKVKGATGSYKFMVCSIVLGEKRFVLYSVPMYRGQITWKLVDEILTRVQKYVRVRLVLCDRGFCHKQTVRILEEKDIRYILLCPRWKNVKRFFEEGELEVIEHTKVFHNKQRYDVDMRYLLAYNIFGHNWAFVSNVRMNMLALILTYKGRWGIETTFRVLDHAEIKSKSSNIVVRTLFFMVAVVLYNAWLEFKKQKDISFDLFLDNLSLASQPIKTILEDWKTARELFGMKISKEEERMLSFRSFYSFKMENDAAPITEI